MTFTEPSRRERKKDETRQRIFDAAIALFREKGFEATTVDEITEKADVGRGTFFNHFPRKETVLAYLSEERLNEAEENVARLARLGASPCARSCCTSTGTPRSRTRRTATSRASCSPSG